MTPRKGRYAPGRVGAAILEFMRISIVPRVAHVAVIVAAASVTRLQARAAEPHFIGERYLHVALRTTSGTVAAGTTTTLALTLEPSPGWHTYGPKPGDVGFAPRFRWSLPAGTHVGPIAWPVTTKRVDGKLVSYVYARPVTLRIPLVVTPHASPMRDAIVALDLDFGVCANVCIPGHVRVTTHVAIAPLAR